MPLLNKIARACQVLQDFVITGGTAVPANKRLLLVRMDAIGDYVLFRPVLRALRETPEFHDYHITLCGNVAWAELATAFDSGYFDDFIGVNRSQFQADAVYRKSIFKRVRQVQASVAVNPVASRDYIGDSLMRASRAERSIGVDGPGINLNRLVKLLTDRYYSSLLPPNGAMPFELHRNFEIFKALTGRECKAELAPLHLDEAQISALPESLHAAFGLPVFCLGASVPQKRWPVKFFAELAQAIHAKSGQKVILVGGTDCNEYAAAIKRLCSSFVHDCTGQTTLIELAALLGRAAFFVSNDSAAAHIAAVAGRPGVIVANGQHMGRFNPYPAELAAHVRTAYPAGLEFTEDNRKKYYWNLSDRNISSVKPEAVIALLAELSVL